MTASGGIKKMLQGSWWLTVTQFCIEGLMVEGEAPLGRYRGDRV